LYHFLVMIDLGILIVEIFIRIYHSDKQNENYIFKIVGLFCKQIIMIIILMIAFFIEARQKRSFIHSINKVKIEELACDHKCWNAHSHIITIQKICQLGNTNIASVTRYDVTRSLEVVVGSINFKAHVVDYDILLQYHIKPIWTVYNKI
jgi:hypothetical protein